MNQPAPSPFKSDIAAALDWWREAGVDADYADAPRAWLSEPEQAAPAPEPGVARRAPVAPAPPPPPAIGGPRAGWPNDVAAFREWWMSEPSLDEGGLSPRIAPSGPAAAELMILVAMPENTDSSDLLSGSHGALLGGFLRAAGVPQDQVYRAAVLPRHTPLADWAGLASQGMGSIVAHHVALARPRRLLVFGQNILPLCGHDPAQPAHNLQSFNHEDGTVPALYEAGLDRLLSKSGLRARLWQRWLDWTDGQAWDEKHG